MGRKEVLAERRALENFYYNCKLETPQEVAKQFEVYTRLIWNPSGRPLLRLLLRPDCHPSGGRGHLVGGKDALEVETLPTFSAYPNKKCNFKEIYAVGDAERGYLLADHQQLRDIFKSGSHYGRSGRWLYV